MEDSASLTIRLSPDDARLIDHLRRKTSLSRTELVKRALRSLAQADDAQSGGLFALGATRFGRYGKRQSIEMKSIVKARTRR